MITKVQEDLITLLITGERISDIAKKLNISRGTVYNWMELDEIKAELDRRKQDLATQGNNYILKDLFSYLDNMKKLANDKTDKRVALTATRYLIDRVLGAPKGIIDDNNDSNDMVDTFELEAELKRFKLKGKADV